MQQILDQEYLVYQHRNVIINEVFYIGSGTRERASQFGERQRSVMWNLYVKNNNLKTDVWARNADVVKCAARKHLFADKVNVEIICVCKNRDEAIKIEQELIQQNYGKQGYKLVNNFMQEHRSSELTKQRSEIVSNARSKAIINLQSNIKYKNAQIAAYELGLKRSTISKQCNNNHARLLNKQALIDTENGKFIFQDDATLAVAI
jgi:hypothetical protein